MISSIFRILQLVFIFFVSLTAHAQIQNKTYDSIINRLKIDAWNLRYSNKLEANKALFRGLGLAKKQNCESDIGYFYRKIIAQKGTSGELDSARIYFYQGIEYYWKTKKLEGKQMNEPGLRAHLLSELAEAYNNNESPDLALKYYLKARSCYQELNDKIGVGIVEINLGNIYLSKGEYAKALAKFENSRLVFDTTDYHEIVAGVYSSINAVYHAMGDYENANISAIKFWKLALKCRYETELVVQANLALAVNEMKLNKWSNAGIHLDQAKQLIEKKKLYFLFVPYSSAYAMYLRNNGKYNKALEILMKYQKLASSTAQGSETRFRFELELAKVNFKLGQINEALDLLKPLGAKAKELKLLHERAEIAQLLSNIYKSVGDYKSAFEKNQEYHQLYVKELGIQRQIRFKEIEQKFKIERKEKLLSLEKAKHEKAKAALIQSELKRKNAFVYQLILGFTILALTMAFFAFYRYSKMKKNQLLYAKNLQAKDEKLRISRDLHDHIGAELTLIKSRIDRKAFGSDSPAEKRELEQISSYAQEAMNQLRKTIWATKHEWISSEDFKNQIDSYVKRFAWDYVLTQTGPEVQLKAIPALNLFRIVQEAIQNAVKHSVGDELRIHISSTEKTFEIEIADNGQGFDFSDDEQGYGLNNMKERAAEILGKVSISSSKKGSIVKIEVPKSEL